VSIGKTLEAARIHAGLSIDQVADATRIRRTLLTAIEHDDFSLCGGDFYARGHIRNIAGVVGADSAPLLAAYDAERGVEAAPSGEVLAGSRSYYSPRRGGTNWSAVLAVALALVVFVGVARILLGGSGAAPQLAGTTPAPAASRAPAPPVRAATVPPRPARPREQADAVAPVRTDMVTVRAAAIATSWLNAVNGTGTTLFEGTLRKGATKTFTAKKKVRLVIGNAGGLRLTVNGRDLGLAGEPQQVARVEFLPGDPTAG
jgi:cytoskeleton protein RodZ